MSAHPVLVRNPIWPKWTMSTNYLSAQFGAPVSDPDYAGAEPDRDTLAWRVGALWLGIAGIHQNGDGDAWQHIWLVCAPIQAAFNAALAGQQASPFDLT